MFRIEPYFSQGIDERAQKMLHLVLMLHIVRHRLIASSQLYRLVVICQQLDRLPYRQKFLNDRNSKICYHSLKDHPKVSKIAKFRCVML